MTASHRGLRKADRYRVQLGLASVIILLPLLTACVPSTAAPPSLSAENRSPLATVVSSAVSTPAHTAPTASVSSSPVVPTASGSSYSCESMPTPVAVETPPQVLLGIDGRERVGQLHFQDWSAGSVGGSITGTTELPETMGKVDAGTTLRLVTGPPVRIDMVRAVAVRVDQRDLPAEQQTSRLLLADYAGSLTAVCFRGPTDAGDWELTLSVTFADSAGRGRYAWRWSF